MADPVEFSAEPAAVALVDAWVRQDIPTHVGQWPTGKAAAADAHAAPQDADSQETLSFGNLVAVLEAEAETAGGGESRVSDTMRFALWELVRNQGDCNDPSSPPARVSSDERDERDGVHLSREEVVAFLRRFGPVSRALAVVDRLILSGDAPWFHGPISTREAGLRLTGAQAGTFLIRFSASTAAKGGYALSCIDYTNTLRHFSGILTLAATEARAPAGAVIHGAARYSSLVSLVNASISEFLGHFGSDAIGAGPPETASLGVDRQIYAAVPGGSENTLRKRVSFNLDCQPPVIACPGSVFAVLAAFPGSPDGGRGVGDNAGSSGGGSSSSSPGGANPDPAVATSPFSTAPLNLSRELLRMDLAGKGLPDGEPSPVARGGRGGGRRTGRATSAPPALIDNANRSLMANRRQALNECIVALHRDASNVSALNKLLDLCREARNHEPTRALIVTGGGVALLAGSLSMAGGTAQAAVAAAISSIAGGGGGGSLGNTSDPHFDTADALVAAIESTKTMNLLLTLLQVGQVPAQISAVEAIRSLCLHNPPLCDVAWRDGAPAVLFRVSTASANKNLAAQCLVCIDELHQLRDAAAATDDAFVEVDFADNAPGGALASTSASTTPRQADILATGDVVDFGAIGLQASDVLSSIVDADLPPDVKERLAAFANLN